MRSTASFVLVIGPIRKSVSVTKTRFIFRFKRDSWRAFSNVVIGVGDKIVLNDEKPSL